MREGWVKEINKGIKGINKGINKGIREGILITVIPYKCLEETRERI